METTIDNYTQELEDLIADVLLPAYVEHFRLLGRPNPTRDINSRLLHIKKQKKNNVPALLQKKKY